LRELRKVPSNEVILSISSNRTNTNQSTRTIHRSLLGMGILLCRPERGQNEVAIATTDGVDKEKQVRALP
jgi:hypothetical protein